MMKVKVIKEFIDIETNKYHGIGEVMVISKERFDDLTSHRIKYVKLIKKVETKKGENK